MLIAVPAAVRRRFHIRVEQGRGPEPMSAGAPEADLYARAAVGDAMAFDALIDPLIEAGYRLALTMVGREADAEDVLQEATLLAWRKIGQLRDPARLRAWYL